MRISIRTVSLASLIAAGLAVSLGVFLNRQASEKTGTVAYSQDATTSPNDAWPPHLDIWEYRASAPSSVPNGGLAIEEKSLWWGEVLETDQFVRRELRLKNPTEQDLHLVFSQYPCGFTIEHSPMTVPAQGEVSLPIALHASTRNPGARDEFVVMRKTFAPLIKEFPGKHPGWTVHCHVTRAMTIDEGSTDRAFVVTPLRKLVAVTASVNGRADEVRVEGPDEANRYLVFVDHHELAKRIPERDSTRLQIRGYLPFGRMTDREIWIQR